MMPLAVADAVVMGTGVTTGRMQAADSAVDRGESMGNAEVFVELA